MAAVKGDYYELLGVDRDADEEAIRKAFHALARDCHPDVSDSPEATQRFRELAEAYGVLSKPGPRLLYDRYGYRGRGNSGFDEELWEGRERAPRGENAHAEVQIRSYEAEEGTRRLVRFDAAAVCADCDGRGTTREPDPSCSVCGGTGRRRQVSHGEVGRMLRVEACPRCAGETCPRCGGPGAVPAQRQLKIRIPSGVRDGTQLRVGGEGSPAPNRGVPGDLLVDLHVSPAPRDSRLVQLLAFALFLVAVVALVLYLL